MTETTDPAPAPKKKSFLKRLLKLGTGLLILLAIVLAVGPAVASATFLTGTVRGQLKKQFGESADVGKVSFGWTDGLVVEGVKLPGKKKDRDMLGLAALRAKFSVPGIAKAALTGGEASVAVEVENAKVFLEVPAEGKAEAAPVASKAAPQPASSEPAKLPFTAVLSMTVKGVDVEIDDAATSKKTVVEGLTFSFDGRVLKELPASAAQAATRALEAIHQLEASPNLDVKRIASDDFDLRGLAVQTSLGPKDGKFQGHLKVDGKLVGLHDGGIKLEAGSDLAAGRGKLPASFELHLNQVEISGLLAKKMPYFLPLLSGTETQKGKAKLPDLSVNTKGEIEVRFQNEQLDQKPTLKTLASQGELLLGPGSFEGSTILQAYADAFAKLELKDVLDKAIGGDPFRYEGVVETFSAKDGVVTIEKLALSRQGLGLSVSGTVDFDGTYALAFHMDERIYAKLAPDVGKILQAVDKAGGIGIAGTFGGETRVSTPPPEVLAKAMLDAGALDLLRAKNPKAAARLDGYLGKAGTSAEKIVADPGKAATDAAKDQAEKQTDKVLDKNKDKVEKIEKATGVDPDKLKKGLGGLFGGSDDK